MDSDQNVKTVDIDVRTSISKSNIPKYSKILVPDDGKEISDKAINHAMIFQLLPRQIQKIILMYMLSWTPSFIKEHSENLRKLLR